MATFITSKGVRLIVPPIEVETKPIELKEVSMKKFTVAYAKAAALRALRTAGQTVVALLGTNLIGITSIDWLAILAVTGTATVLSIATSLGSLPEAKLPEPNYEVQ
jgi:hypothetical protein